MRHTILNFKVLAIFALNLVLTQSGFGQTNPESVDISTFNASTPFFSTSDIQPGNRSANQFQVITSIPMSINRIDLVFSMSTGENALTGLTVSIWSDTGTSTGQPNSQLGLPFSYKPNTVTTNGTVQFASFYYSGSGGFNNYNSPGSKYWLVLQPTSGKVQWQKVAGTNQIVNSLGTAAVNPVEVDYKSSWSSPNSQIMAFAIHSAPEPATYLLGLVTTIVLAIVARRKRGSKSSLPPNAMLSTVQS